MPMEEIQLYTKRLMAAPIQIKNWYLLFFAKIFSCYEMFQLILCHLVGDRALLSFDHRDNIRDTERANMHCWGIACTKSLDMGLTTAKDKKLDCFK